MYIHPVAFNQHYLASQATVTERLLMTRRCGLEAGLRPRPLAGPLQMCLLRPWCGCECVWEVVRGVRVCVSVGVWVCVLYMGTYLEAPALCAKIHVPICTLSVYRY